MLFFTMILNFIVEIVPLHLSVMALKACSLSLISSFLVTLVRATPVPHWMEPCRGSLESNTELPMSSLHNTQSSDQLLAHRLWIKASNVELLATLIRDLMASERIQSTDLQHYLDENTTLPGFPDYRSITSSTQFTVRLLEDYRRVAVAAIFVEEMHSDEERSSYSPSYTIHFRHLESQIYPLLCQLKMALSNREARLPRLRHDAMHTSLRNVDTHAQRHMRDYRILIDIVRLFHSIQVDYDSLRSGNQISLQVENR